MALKFLYNNTTYTCSGEQTTKPSTVNAIGFIDTDGKTKYLWASSTRGTSVQVYEDTNYIYKINNSSPSICFSKGGTTYYVGKSLTKTANTERTISGSYVMSWSLTWYSQGFYAGGGGISSAKITLNKSLGKAWTIRPCVYYGSSTPTSTTTPYYAGSSVSVSATATSVSLGTATNGGQLGNKLYSLWWGFQYSLDSGKTWKAVWQGHQDSAQNVSGTKTGSTTTNLS